MTVEFEVFPLDDRFSFNFYVFENSIGYGTFHYNLRNDVTVINNPRTWTKNFKLESYKWNKVNLK